MILGVLSDSHDHLANVEKAVAVFKDRKIEALIHGGDFCSPFVFNYLKELQTICPQMHAVFGNNDGDRVLLTLKGKGFCTFRDGALVLKVGGRVIAVMHYPDVAESLHRSGDYDLVIFGHSHQARVEGSDRLLLNPGSCAGYLAQRATVAVVDLETLTAELIDLDG
jgi:putative phosphoesterase